MLFTISNFVITSFNIFFPSTVLVDAQNAVFHFLNLFYAPLSKCPGETSDFRQGITDRKIWSNFRQGLRLSTKEGMIFGEKLYLLANSLPDFPPLFISFQLRFCR